MCVKTKAGESQWCQRRRLLRHDAGSRQTDFAASSTSTLSVAAPVNSRPLQAVRPPDTHALPTSGCRLPPRSPPQPMTFRRPRSPVGVSHRHRGRHSRRRRKRKPPSLWVTPPHPLAMHVTGLRWPSSPQRERVTNEMPVRAIIKATASC